MMMYSTPMSTRPMRNLRRRSEEEYGNAQNMYQNTVDYQTFSPTACPHPNKKFKTSLADHMQTYNAPNHNYSQVWYDVNDVSSPESDDMDISGDVEMDDGYEYDTTPDAQIVQYTQQSTEKPSYREFNVPFQSRHISTCKIEEIFDDEPSTAIVLYRPLPPASSWKVEPESENEDTQSQSYDDDAMEID